ncbi:MAG: hypothetical protein V7K35_26590 [Nostoc sp.]
MIKFYFGQMHPCDRALSPNAVANRPKPSNPPRISRALLTLAIGLTLVALVVNLVPRFAV